MLNLSAADVRRALDPRAAYDSQTAAFRHLGDGTATLAERLLLPGRDGDATAFCYAARLHPGAPPVCKFGAVSDGNRGRGLPSVHATVYALDPHTGLPLLVADGEAVTQLRTPAATAVALDHLAPAEPATIAVLGAGVQGAAHVRALASRAGKVLLHSRDHDRARRVAGKLRTEWDLPVEPVGDAAAAVSAASIVITCTSATTTVVQDAWVRPGTTVLSIGSFAPDRCEVTPAFVGAADIVVVDHLPTALRHAGPVMQAVRAGLRDAATIRELGTVVAQRAHVRAGAAPDAVVFYNSVGLGVQDAAAVTTLIDFMSQR